MTRVSFPIHAEDAVPAIDSFRATGFGEWQSRIASSFVSSGSSTSAEGPRIGTFTGRLRTSVLDGISVADVRAGPHEILRTPLDTAAYPQGAFKIGLLLSGSAVLDQHGGSTAMRPGDFGLCHLDRPYTFRFTSDFRCVVFLVSGRDLGAADGLLGAESLTRINLSTAEQAVTGPLVAAVGEQLPYLSGPFGQRTVRAAVGLLGQALAREVGVPADGAGTIRRRRLADLQRMIDGRLDDPDLTIDRVAAESYLSRRTIQLLFQFDGLTFSGWVRERRLEKCRQDLLAQGHETTIASIGARWGFANAGHFGKVFKERYGYTPSDLINGAR